MELFKRSVYCGQVSQGFIGKEVFLCGWVQGRRDLGGLIFIDMRDRTGIMQLVFNPENDNDLFEKAQSLRSEFVISVRGTVVERSTETVNKNMQTGSYELVVLDLSIISTSPTPPFEIEDETNALEDLRLKYRYLDLRRPKMHRYINLRHKITFAIRDYLNKLEFYEIETPILSKSTPEGARDFLVPSRLQPGTFYALPQSPQLYKQLLMSAGMEKYFQIVRCFRDEDFRANRQPEFTQLDLEMSFVKAIDIQTVAEGIIGAVWESVNGEAPSLPFPRMTYDEAFSRFGSDKPDVRFGLEIQDITSVFEQTEVRFLEKVIKANGKIGALHVKGKSFSKSACKAWEERAKKYFGASGLLWVTFYENGTFESPISKILPENLFLQIRDVIPSLSPGDTLFIVADSYVKAWTALGRLRLELSQQLGMISESGFNFLWVTDFPLLEWSEDEKRWYAKHHPDPDPDDSTYIMDMVYLMKDGQDVTCRRDRHVMGIFSNDKWLQLINDSGFTARIAEYKADYYPPMGTHIFLGMKVDTGD